ncbi:MAG TPA: response regulator transcription factor [Solirubrobacterales bacterium]
MGSNDASARPAAIRVLIVDDHALFRRGLREHLEASGLVVVGETADAIGALALSVEREPEVVLMDIRMPGDSGIDAIRQLRLAAPRARVLLMADSLEEEDIVEAIMAGASGCLPKDSDGDQILAAVSAAAGGESALSPRIVSALIERARKHEPPPPSSASDGPTLTEREHEVLGLIVEGKDNNEIAAALVISPETVKSHVSTVLGKLGAGNRAEAAVKAVRAGLA